MLMPLTLHVKKKKNELWISQFANNINLHINPNGAWSSNKYSVFLLHCLETNIKKELKELKKTSKR